MNNSKYVVDEKIEKLVMLNGVAHLSNSVNGQFFPFWKLYDGFKDIDSSDPYFNYKSKRFEELEMLRKYYYEDGNEISSL